MTAFLLMAFATTLPEFFVGITSAINKKPEISFGNVIGSNIINLTLAVALPVLMFGALRARSKIIQRTSIYVVLIAVMPLALMLDGELSRLDGFLLLFTLTFYIKSLLSQKKRFSKPLNNNPENELAELKGFLKDIGVFLLAVVFLLASAQGIVWTASQIASSLGVSLLLISILFIALGTNLPEIVFSLKSASANHKEMVLGNLTGAVAANTGLILGMTFLIHPLKIDSFSLYLTGLVFTILTVLFFAVFIRSDREITRKEGFLLLVVYLAFVLTQVLA